MYSSDDSEVEALSQKYQDELDFLYMKLGEQHDTVLVVEKS